MRRIAVNRSTMAIALVFTIIATIAGSRLGSRIDMTVMTVENNRRSETLVEDLLRRAELAADHALITMFDFADGGFGACGADGIAAVETKLLSQSAVRGVILLDAPGKISCAVPQAIGSVAGDEGWATSSFLAARNEKVSIGHVGELLLVQVEQGIGSMIAATSFDTILFGALPAEIRDMSTAKVVLSGGNPIAYFSGSSAPDEVDSASHKIFSTTSTRYPINVQIAVPQDTFAAWGNQGGFRYDVAGGMIGFLAAGFLAALVLRTRTARDDLLEAMNHGHIVPYYQPIFRLDNGALSGCEALVRWIKPDGSRVGPDRFIPLAENEGLIAQLTEQMATNCARDLGAICRHNPHFKLSLNTPPDLLLDDTFIRRLETIFRRENLPLQNVVLEVTERQSLSDARAVGKTIDAAIERGWRFALDDTGVGHNGLSNVQALSVDFIKIDKCFVDMVDSVTESASIVKMLVALARDLGRKTVAEGIEREEQWLALQELGVDEGQGYVVAPALAPAEFLLLCAKWPKTIEADTRVSEEASTAKPHHTFLPQRRLVG